MKMVSLTELKNNFSALIDLVKKGKETLLVCERDVPVIKIVWAAHGSSDPQDANTGLVKRLERAGHLVRSAAGQHKLNIEELTVSLNNNSPDKSADILKALLDERNEGR